MEAVIPHLPISVIELKVLMPPKLSSLSYMIDKCTTVTLGIGTLHLTVRNFPVLGFSHQFFRADMAKCPGICSQFVSGAS